MSCQSYIHCCAHSTIPCPMSAYGFQHSMLIGWRLSPTTWLLPMPKPMVFGFASPAGLPIEVAVGFHDFPCAYSSSEQFPKQASLLLSRDLHDFPCDGAPPLGLPSLACQLFFPAWLFSGWAGGLRNLYECNCLSQWFPSCGCQACLSALAFPAWLPGMVTRGFPDPPCLCQCRCHHGFAFPACLSSGRKRLSRTSPMLMTMAIASLRWLSSSRSWLCLPSLVSWWDVGRLSSTTPLGYRSPQNIQFICQIPSQNFPKVSCTIADSGIIESRKAEVMDMNGDGFFFYCNDSRAVTPEQRFRSSCSTAVIP